MGQAKRRKLAGDYPTVTPKPRAETRIKPPFVPYGQGFIGKMLAIQSLDMFGPPKRKGE